MQYDRYLNSLSVGAFSKKICRQEDNIFRQAKTYGPLLPCQKATGQSDFQKWIHGCALLCCECCVSVATDRRDAGWSAWLIVPIGGVVIHESRGQSGQDELDRLPIDDLHGWRESITERLLDCRHKWLFNCLRNWNNQNMNLKRPRAVLEGHSKVCPLWSSECSVKLLHCAMIVLVFVLHFLMLILKCQRRAQTILEGQLYAAFSTSWKLIWYLGLGR